MRCILTSLIYPLIEVSKEVFMRCILTSLIYPLIEVSKEVSRLSQLMTACRFKAPLLPVTQFKLNTRLQVSGCGSIIFPQRVKRTKPDTWRHTSWRYPLSVTPLHSLAFNLQSAAASPLRRQCQWKTWRFSRSQAVGSLNCWSAPLRHRECITWVSVNASVIVVSQCSAGSGFRHWKGGRGCLLYTSPSPRDWSASRMPSSA